MYHTDYKTYKNKNGSRDVLRSLALSGLAAKSKWFNEHKKYLNSPMIQFLYLHHFFDDELANLKNLLSVLSKYYTFISYSDAVEKIMLREIDRPYLVFSSDDGLKNNLNAINAFSEYGVKACFFINPTSVGLSSDKEIVSFCKNKLNSKPVEFMNWNDIDILMKDGHEIGSHTMDHLNVANANLLDAQRNIENSKQIIQNRCGSVEHFAFPYGTFSDFSSDAAKLVYEMGFSSVASAVRGAHSNHPTEIIKEQLCIRRDHVILAWPVAHIMYFLINNAKRINPSMNLFPY